MDRLRATVAILIVAVWTFVVVWAAVRKPELVGLVTVISPPMMGVVGYLYADAVLRRSPRGSKKKIVAAEDEQEDGGTDD